MLQCASGDSGNTEPHFLVERRTVPRTHGAIEESSMRGGSALGANEQRPSATPAHVGVLPIPLKLRMNLLVVANPLPQTKEHTDHGGSAESDKHSDGARMKSTCLRVLMNRTHPRKAPGEKDHNGRAPDHQWADITTRARRGDRLGCECLCCSGTECSGIGPRALLEKYRGSHDVCTSALVALIRIVPSCGFHRRSRPGDTLRRRALRV